MRKVPQVHRSLGFGTSSWAKCYRAFFVQLRVHVVFIKKKKHFHPPEHICIQSEGRNNAIHSNCMLSLAGVNADLRGSAASFSQPGCLC